MRIFGARTLRRITQQLFFKPITQVASDLGVQRAAHWLRAQALRARWRLTPHLSQRKGPISAATFAKTFHMLSSRGGYFFSDNLISNERGYLDALPALAHLRGQPHAYLGVGPEQSLSYLAYLGSELALIVDIRRDNALLHFLYKACFALTQDRGGWLSLLLGLPSQAMPAQTPLAALIARVDSEAPTEGSFLKANAAVLNYLKTIPKLLSARELRRVAWLHRQFFERQLNITFQLRARSIREYPTLRALLTAQGPDGVGSFLATHDAFVAVQAMSNAHRIIPVVGDLAGEFTLPAIGSLLRQLNLQVGALYVSNVEQYLFEDNTWARWLNSLQRLPWHPNAAMVRSHFDRGNGKPPPSSTLGMIGRAISMYVRAYTRPQTVPPLIMQTKTQPARAFLESQQTKPFASYPELVHTASPAPSPASSPRLRVSA